MESWAGGYHTVSFYSLSEFEGQTQQQDLVETRAEVVLDQTLQGPAAVVLVGLGLPQVSGRTLLCQCWAKKVSLTTILCVSLCHSWRRYSSNRTPCGLGSSQSVVDWFPWSQSVLKKQCRFWRRERHLFV